MSTMVIVLMTSVILQPVAVQTAQGPPGRKGKAPESASLTAIKNAVEARFRKLEANSTVRLRYVSVAPRPKRGAVLEVGLTPPTDQKFEFHAETAYMLIWQALMKEKNAFKELGRVQVSLNRSGRQMLIDCPIESVEDSVGYTDFARLKRLCKVS
ncbi:MAG TPA: hypothetical protein VJ837_02695 [Candidatus Paceibacterota bacterium]|nr:hypothetical protein [Candidatus Paceibacterota bacterium]